MIYQLRVTCADGLETLLSEEIKALGVDSVEIQPGRCSVQATLEQAYRVALWSRTASRVFLFLFDVTPTDRHERDVAEEIFTAAREFDWSLLFPVQATFALDVQADPKLPLNPRFATLRFKDGLVDSYRELTGRRPSIDLEAPDIQLMVQAGFEQHQFWLDFGGGSLHRRGYRTQMTPAPLKENLAAALLLQSGWPGSFQALLDPACGSGTLLIEALWLWTDIAPGLLRAEQDGFGFYAWQGHRQAMWDEICAEAQHRRTLGQAKPAPLMMGFDAEESALTATWQNATTAGLDRRALQLAHLSLAQWPTDLAKQLGSNALVICNPPYGERLGVRDHTRAWYLGLNLKLQEHLAGNTAAVLAAQIECADLLQLAEPTTHRFYNGRLSVYLRTGRIQPLAEQRLIFHWQPVTYTGEGQDFANRLQKNIKHLFKLARRDQIGSLRLYDADLPDYNLAIDLYDQRLHVQEYAPPKSVDPEQAKKRLQLALHICRQVLGLSREQIFIKTRQRQRGNQQYTRQEQTRRVDAKQLVQEGQGWFLINMTDYLDTGLFLDHRPLRLDLAEQAEGLRVLNLFSYTCTASVHAALGGASKVTSVDLSGRYLDWGRDNFLVNGFYLEDDRYQFIEADVFEWLKDHTGKFDLIFVDPPTFSNSKKFQGTFDVQRDHVALLKRALNRLSPEGSLYFSNNYRRFELDEMALQGYAIECITRQTIGFDFQRSPGIHQAWQIRHSAPAS